MRFDDTLETVLAGDLSTPFGMQSAWRQLVDLIGRRRVPADSRAIGVLKAIRDDVKPPVRAATARMLEIADPPEALARLFILDEFAIAAPVIRSARLTSDEWIALLPHMAPLARTVLRNRRDIGPRVARALEAFGSIDLVLGDGRPEAESAVVQQAELVDTPQSDVPDNDCPEMGPPLVEGGDTGPDKGATVSPMSSSEQSDASMTPSGDTIEDAPRHGGAPRFVQFGAVAFGIPVVAQAVRMAGDSPDHTVEGEAVAVSVEGAGVQDVSGDGAADPGRDVATHGDESDAAVADALPVPLDERFTQPNIDFSAPEQVEDGDVAQLVSADVPDASGLADAPSPILPVADALRLAESFPLDVPMVDDGAGDEAHGVDDTLEADGVSIKDGGQGEPLVADTLNALMSGPLGLAGMDDSERNATTAAEDAVLTSPEEMAAPVTLLETGIGSAAMGGLAILSAVSDWSRALAGHLDAATPPARTPPASELADVQPDAGVAAAMPDEVVAADVDTSTPDAPDQAAPLDPPVADAVADDGEDLTPLAQAEVADADLEGASVSPLALAGIGAGLGSAAFVAPVLDDAPAEDVDGDATPMVAEDVAPADAPHPTDSDAEIMGDAPDADAPVLGDAGDAAAPDPAADTIVPIEPPTVQAAPGADDTGRTFRIADVVARIDAYQKRQADEAATPSAPIPGDGFRFEADARGLIRWVEGVGRGPLIGLALDQTAPAGGHGFDASVAGAFRHRASFSNARLGVAGESDASGDWLVSAVPCFDPQTGRFTGYRGAARRPRLDERAEQPAAKRPNPVESLRELIHELRTPAGAITGFAELIETQMLGPVPEVYRDQAMAIRTQARELLAVIDDLDLAARIEARALELRPGSVPLKRLVDGIVSQLAPLAQERQVVLERAWGDDVVKGDERAVDRLIARLLATLVGAGTAGETLNVRIAREGADMVRIEMTRPAALDVDAPTEPGEDDVAALGTGFALRLAVNLAQELGGNLMFAADRLTLRLPGADDPHVDQAVHH